jgi:hypothetical protein
MRAIKTMRRAKKVVTKLSIGNSVAELRHHSSG